MLESALTGRLRLAELEPEEAAGLQREQVGQVADRRELRRPEHLLGNEAAERGEVELDGLGGAREVLDADDDLVVPPPDVREDPRVVRAERLVAAEPEDGVLLAELDEAAQPAEERRRGAQLRLAIYGLVAVHRIHQRL